MRRTSRTREHPGRVWPGGGVKPEYIGNVTSEDIREWIRRGPCRSSLLWRLQELEGEGASPGA